MALKMSNIQWNSSVLKGERLFELYSLFLMLLLQISS